MEGGGDDASAWASEVVVIGAADLLDEAVHAQALDHAGDLGAGKVRQQLTEVADLEAADVELASHDGEEEFEVERIEEVDAAVAAVGVSNGASESSELLTAGAGVVEAG